MSVESYDCLASGRALPFKKPVKGEKGRRMEV
jgi:hypothetical protein